MRLYCWCGVRTFTTLAGGLALYTFWLSHPDLGPRPGHLSFTEAGLSRGERLGGSSGSARPSTGDQAGAGAGTGCPQSSPCWHRAQPASRTLGSGLLRQRALALSVPLPADLRPAQKPSDRLVQPQPSEVKLLQEQAEHLGTEDARVLAEILAYLQLGQTLVGLRPPRRGDC